MILGKSRKPFELEASQNNTIDERGVDKDDINWEAKLKKLNEQSKSKIAGIDKELKTCTDALKAPEQNYNYLFSTYLGLINKRKNVVLNKNKTVVKSYNDERKAVRYAVVLKWKHFDNKKDLNKKVVFYFTR
mmetsp:Transcript_20105/g.23290  ORF Transcript_20105/g.23290 Transcript_20105/m.23290 type:complete len:132 (+) Transcript_20105:224-619(+)